MENTLVYKEVWLSLKQTAAHQEHKIALILCSHKKIELSAILLLWPGLEQMVRTLAL